MMGIMMVSKKGLCDGYGHTEGPSCHSSWGLTSCVHSVAESRGPALVHPVIFPHPGPFLKTKGLGHRAVLPSRATRQASGSIGKASADHGRRGPPLLS